MIILIEQDLGGFPIHIVIGPSLCVDGSMKGHAKLQGDQVLLADGQSVRDFLELFWMTHLLKVQVQKSWNWCWLLYD